jgi:hypothetical protein
MKANELRIGNYVYDTLGKVNTYIVKEPHNQVKPIPLTEEWLLKFGFERSGLYNVKDEVYVYDEYGLTDTGFEYRFNYTQIKLKYVNQLQNLYFALTGKELTFKSE